MDTHGGLVATPGTMTMPSMVRIPCVLIEGSCKVYAVCLKDEDYDEVVGV